MTCWFPSPASFECFLCAQLFERLAGRMLGWAGKAEPLGLWQENIKTNKAIRMISLLDESEAQNSDLCLKFDVIK